MLMGIWGQWVAVERGFMRHIVRLLAGIVVGGVLFAFLFRGADWPTIGRAIRSVRWQWVLASQVFAWGSYFTRVQRWTYVVRAVRPASYRNLFCATQIGFLVNFTVPARLGELVRAYVLSRSEQRPLAQSVALVGLDRVNDLVSLLAVFLVAALAVPQVGGVVLPAGTFSNAEPIAVPGRIIHSTSLTLAALVIALLAGLVLAYFNQALVIRCLDRVHGPGLSTFARRFRGFFAQMAEGLHVFRSNRDLARAVFFSLVTWVANLASLAALFAAFGIEFPWFAPFVALSLIAASISLPIAPGVVGQYHLAVVAALIMCVPDLPPAEAKAVAFVGHLLMLLPIAVLGAVCLVSEKVNVFRAVRHPQTPLDE